MNSLCVIVVKVFVRDTAVVQLTSSRGAHAVRDERGHLLRFPERTLKEKKERKKPC